MPSRLLRACPAFLALLAAPAVAQDVPLDPTTPLAPLPELGVDWPDLTVRDPSEATPAATETGNETPRYAVALTGVDGLPDTVAARFDELSTLREGEGDPANLAQIDRRARADTELLNTLLRAEGYYDATIASRVEPVAGSDRVAVTLTVEPGPRYRFADVDLPGLSAAGSQAPELRETYGVVEGAPIVAEDVIAGEARLRDQLGREGYPFARVAEPDIVIDHDTRTATLDLAVEPGGQRRFGAIRLEGDNAPFDADHVQTIARFAPGELYDQAMVDDLRRALIATGLVSTVRLAPVEGSAAGTVDLATTIEPAPYRTLAGEIGYGTGEGFRIEASWQHRNLIRPEGAVTFRGVAGTREQLLGAILRMGNFRQRDQVLNGRVLASRTTRAAYDASTFELAGSIERQTNIIWQKQWTWSVGAELLASDERSVDLTTNLARRRTFFIGALPGTLGYDGSDDLLDPTRGFRLSGRLSPELSLQGRTFGYVRAQLDASGYIPVGGGTVLAGRARVGTTAGASRNSIAPSRLYYAGGGGSVRGYGYQLIGPRNAFDEPIGGRALAELSLEARVRLPVFGGNFGVVPFVDAGNVYTGALPDFSGLRYGAGLGLRYYSNFGPIRIDVGTPLSRRSGDPRIAVYVSLGQAF